MNVIVLVIVVMLFTTTFATQAFAHTTVAVEPYEIEVGWGIEPPVVGIRNDFVFKITETISEQGSFVGVKNAFKDLEATAIFGGASKRVDINSDSRIGYYYASVIPTKTGSYSMQLKGEIDDMPINVQIPIEDVESTAILDFPPTSGASNQDIAALKNAISDIQRDVADIRSGTGINTDTSLSYDFAILGLSIASAAIILAVISLVKRK